MGILISIFVAFGTVCIALPSKSFIFAEFALAFFGFTIIPILGIGYTFTGMNFLPVSPAASCGIVHIANSLVTFLLNALISLVIDKNIWGAIIILASSIFVANIFGAFCWESIPKNTHSVKVRSIMSVIFTY